MKKTKKSFGFPTAALCLFVLAGLIHVVKTDVSLLQTLCFLSTTLIYSGLIICWAVLIARRFISDRIRKMLMSMALFLLVYILIRTVKYRFISVELPGVSRCLWYIYYIPQIFAPLISFVTACTVGKPEDERLSNRWILVFAAGTVLAVGILTNDFHQLAFRFSENFENWETDYSYGFLFYAVTVWIYFFMFASIIMLWRKCKVASIKHRVWLPLIWLPVGTFLVIILSAESITGIESIFELPEIHCFILAAVWECCIQIGLIPCNTGYGEYFSNSGLAVQIADSDDNVVYRSESASVLTKEQMRFAKKAPVLISKNTLLHSKTVCGGNIFWTEDLTAVNRMNGELREIGERLSEESDLLRAENEIKEQKARIDEQNRLYDRIAVLVKPQLDEIARLLDSGDDFKRRMELVCVLNCFVKRRANLTLLADGNTEIELRELFLSIRESAEYLKLSGISCYVELEKDGLVKAGHVLIAFDIWQSLIEAGMTKMTAVLANIESADGSIRLKMNIDGAEKIPCTGKYREMLDSCGGRLEIDEEDSTAFVNLLIPKGGDGK